MIFGLLSFTAPSATAVACGLAGGPTMIAGTVRAIPNPSATPTIGEFPSPVLVNQNINFSEDLSQTNFSSSGKPVTLQWDFGDGTVVTTSQQNIQHSYVHPSTSYDIKVNILDSTTGSYDPLDSSSLQVLSTPWSSPPVAIAAVDHFPVNGGTMVNFDGSASYSRVGSNLMYSWNFGDGQGATGEKVSHRYVLSGPATVTLTVTDSRGAQGIDQIPVTIGASGSTPTASFVTSGQAIQSQAVTFDAGASSPVSGGGHITSYSWDFGDGTKSTTGNPQIEHVYSQQGAYRITLTVTDNTGNTGASMQVIHVGASAQSSVNSNPTSTSTATAVTATNTPTATSTATSPTATATAGQSTVASNSTEKLPPDSPKRHNFSLPVNIIIAVTIGTILAACLAGHGAWWGLKRQHLPA